MLRKFAVVFCFILLCLPLMAQTGADPDGFTGTDLIVPAAGQVQGGGRIVFTTSDWVTNPTTETVTYELQFLQPGRANPNPARSNDTIAPGQTKVYENAAQSLSPLQS